MKNKKILERALDHISDDLIIEAMPFERSTPINRRFISRPFAYMSVAVIMIVITTLIILPVFFKKDTQTPTTFPTTNVPTATEPEITLPIIENFWELDDFQAYTFSYTSEEPVLSSDKNAVLKTFSEMAVEKDIVSELLIDPTNIKINIKNNVNIESVIDDRYIAYYSQEGSPLFYDTEKNKEIDLEKQILGDRCINDYIINLAYLKAEELLPGCTNNNKEFLKEYIITNKIKERVELFNSKYKWEDLDFSFFDYLGNEYKELSEQNKINLVFSIFDQASWEVEKLDDYSYISIMGIDSRNGFCYYTELNLRGYAKGFYKYDISKDTSTKFQKLSINTGFEFNYSEDGSIITIASPIVNGGNLFVYNNEYDAIYKNHTIANKYAFFQGYNGEEVTALKYNSEGELITIFSDSINTAASKVFISSDNSVLYYKKYAMREKNFVCSHLVWYNRLDLFNDEYDTWIFRTINDDSCSEPISLNGEFVKFIADNTAVVMKKYGKIKVYSLYDGSDITQEASMNMLMGMKSHDRFEIIMQNGDLYKKDIFTNKITPIFKNVESYFISSDNAFVFVHENGNDSITCINIANLKNNSIKLTKEIIDAINKGSYLDITYNRIENTLLISYVFKDKSVITNEYSNVDFYHCLKLGKDFDPTRDINKEYNTTICYDYTINEKTLNSFRTAVDNIIKSGYKNDNYRKSDKYNPCNIKYYDSVDQILEKLEIEIELKDLYHDIFLTEFVLYEDDDEKIVLYTTRSWIKYGSQNENILIHNNYGINIVYYCNDRVFEFLNPKN
ncbi:MAG: hypothetical protein E7675_02045 [Ruminococcaceae bacterium]|nr:hypothetical protein [Oscillospiraceae bacterium]